MATPNEIELNNRQATLAANVRTMNAAHTKRSFPVTSYGVSIAGAEFGSTFPGKLGNDYFFETPTQLKALVGAGFRNNRLPVKAERISNIDGSLNTAGVSELRTYLDQIYAAGMTVELDIHNYARFSSGGTEYQIGSTQYPVSAFTMMWKKIVETFETHQAIAGWCIMNEPHDLSGGAVAWETAAQAAVNAIAAAGSAKTIIVPTYGYSSLAYLSANHSAPWIAVPAGANIAYECHYYHDDNGNPDNVYATVAAKSISDGWGTLVERAQKAVDRWVTWAAGAKLYLGECGIPLTSEAASWIPAHEALMQACVTNGVTVRHWGGGSNWPASEQFHLFSAAGIPRSNAAQAVKLLRGQYSPAVATTTTTSSGGGSSSTVSVTDLNQLMGL